MSGAGDPNERGGGGAGARPEAIASAEAGTKAEAAGSVPTSTPSPERPLVLIGAGKMGGAMLGGWLAAGRDPRQIVVVEPEPSEMQALMTPGLRLEERPPDVRAHTIVIAVKPQGLEEIIPTLRPLCDEDTLIVSIAAGITVATLSTLGEGPVVRAIPNTPAAVGKGATVAFANALGDAQRSFVDKLLGSIGLVRWVDSEDLIDAATAVSGSGPAYVFALAESLSRAGVAVGLPEDVATTLARQTVIGAGALLERSELDPTELRRNVTSPGGTTAAALDVLTGEDGLDALIRRTVEAAARRSRELGR